MKIFRIWETVQGSTNAYYEAKEGDIIETLGARERKEQYKVDKIYVSDRGKDSFGITEGHIIKKDGTVGKKTIKLANRYDEYTNAPSVDTSVHTR